MRPWLESIHTLAAGMLFADGHWLPRNDGAAEAPMPRPKPPQRRTPRAPLLQRCAEALRWPRLVQPH